MTDALLSKIPSAVLLRIRSSNSRPNNQSQLAQSHNATNPSFTHPRIYHSGNPPKTKTWLEIFRLLDAWLWKLDGRSWREVGFPIVVGFARSGVCWWTDLVGTVHLAMIAQGKTMVKTQELMSNQRRVEQEECNESSKDRRANVSLGCFRIARSIDSLDLPTPSTDHAPLRLSSSFGDEEIPLSRLSARSSVFWDLTPRRWFHFSGPGVTQLAGVRNARMKNDSGTTFCIPAGRRRREHGSSVGKRSGIER